MALSLRRREGSQRDLTSIVTILLLSILYVSIETFPGPRISFGVDAALAPSHDGTNWNPRDYDFSLDVMKREDICSETLPGSVTSNCTPSNTTVTTLCCVRPDSVFPQCGVYLDVGFCVVDEAGGSYTDTESVCDSDPNAVVCDSDDENVYCCPEHTSCAEDGYVDGAVRCEASTSDLESLTATPIRSSVATPTSIDITTTTESTSSTMASTSKTSGVKGKVTGPPQNEPEDEDDGGGLSGGAVAGIVVGAFAALVITAFLIWFLIKRRRNFEPDGQNGKGLGMYGYFNADRKTRPYMKHEMDAEGTALPMPPHELDPHSRGSSVSRTTPQELATPINARPQSPQEMEAPVSTFSPFQEQTSQSR